MSHAITSEISPQILAGASNLPEQAEKTAAGDYHDLIARTSPARPATGLGAIDQLLRDRGAILDRIGRDVRLVDLARVMLVTIAVSSAVFGAAIGTYRGGIQILYAALKFPLLMLLTAAICAPGLSAFNAALDRPTSLRRDLALVLSSLALGGLILVAQAPILLLASSLEVAYHSIILLTFACCALAGLGSLIMVSRGVRATSPRRTGSAILALVMLFSVVGAQMAWTLRPYVVRPRTPSVPFVRSIEGNLIEAVTTSLDSARGHYNRDYAPLPGGTTPRSYHDVGDFRELDTMNYPTKEAP
jgi:hypothetical protein